jgi:hypothetical protein
MNAKVAKGVDFQIFTPHPGPLPVWRGEGVVNREIRFLVLTPALTPDPLPQAREKRSPLLSKPSIWMVEYCVDVNPRFRSPNS